jgi:hypothetical protein
VYDCKNYLVGGLAGGRYELDHCTLVNTPTSFFRSDPSIQFSDNVVLDDETMIVGELSVQIRNSILWGSLTGEFTISNGGGADVTTLFDRNIYKSQVALVGGPNSTQSNFPKFKNPALFDYRLDEKSPAIDFGASLGITIDVLGQSRSGAPDSGAYEWVAQ